MSMPLPFIAAIAGLAILSACGGLRPAVLSNPAPAAPAVPAPLAGTPTDRLLAAIGEAGCVLTSANRDAVLSRAGLGLTDLATIMPQLNADGRAEAANADSIRILSDVCI